VLGNPVVQVGIGSSTQGSTLGSTFALKKK
jgi:hypothetical protein